MLLFEDILSYYHYTIDTLMLTDKLSLNCYILYDNKKLFAITKMDITIINILIFIISIATAVIGIIIIIIITITVTIISIIIAFTKFA